MRKYYNCNWSGTCDVFYQYPMSNYHLLMGIISQRQQRDRRSLVNSLNQLEVLHGIDRNCVVPNITTAKPAMKNHPKCHQKAVFQEMVSFGAITISNGTRGQLAYIAPLYYFVQWT